MAIYRDGSRRRRRLLAAPFVVTVALAPACVVTTSDGANKPTEPTKATPVATASDAGPTMIANPPRPSAPDAGAITAPVIANPPPPALPAAPAGKGTWTESGGQWTYAYDDGGRVWLDAAGNCRYTAPRRPCPAGAVCNPPPPVAVQCPDGLPAAARKPSK